MSEDILLAENIATKLCHDLASPIGAINNGIELLELDPGDDKAMELLQENACSLLAHIRFYRLMLGKLDETGEMDLEKLRTIWSDFFKGSRINFQLKMSDDSKDYVTLTGAAAKIITLALFSAQQIGFTGGTVELILTRNKEYKAAKIVINAKRIIINESIENFLVKKTHEEPNTHNIFLYLMFRLAKNLPAEIDFSYGGENAIVDIVFKKAHG